MMAISFCRGFSTIHIKGAGKALSLSEVWNSRVGWMINGTRWTGGLNAVIQMLSPDLDLRQRDGGETVTDPLGFREVLMSSVRAEAKTDGRQWNCLCPHHLNTEWNRFNDLTVDNMLSLTRRIQICSIVIIYRKEHLTLIVCVIIKTIN